MILAGEVFTYPGHLRYFSEAIDRDSMREGDSWGRWGCREAQPIGSRALSVGPQPCR